MSRFNPYAAPDPAPEQGFAPNAIDPVSIAQAFDAAPDMAMHFVPKISARALEPAAPPAATLSTLTKRGIRARRRAGRH